MTVKARPADLAIFGGPRAFPEFLHVGRPNIGDRTRLRARFEDAIDRRWLTNDGPYVQEFEARIASLLGVEHCVATANGTLALEIAIRACDLTGEVIVPAFTFVATAHALQWQGLTPVFCDIKPDTHNLDPALAATLITPRTTGIIGVHMWGRPAPVRALEQLASAHGLRLLFDAAHALGCGLDGRMIGTFGDAEILSFHATKVVNASEGGAIVTNNGDLAARARSMRNFGFAGYDRVVSVGTNGKMGELAAAMGLTSLEALPSFTHVNQENYGTYRRGLDGVRGLHLVEYGPTDTCNYQYVVLEIDQACGISRDQLLRALIAEGIMARRYFYPGCHRMEPYRSAPDSRWVLPATEQLCGRVIQLPTGTAVGAADIEMICQLVRLAVDGAGDLQRLRPVDDEGLYE